jgi:hypothetical protein
VSILNGTAITNGSGVATFVGLALLGAAPAGYALHFAAGAAATDAGATALAPGTAVAMSVSVDPPVAAQNDVPFTTAPVVNVKDAGNANVPGAVVTVSATGGAFLVATATTDALGNATFTGLRMSGVIGNYLLEFTTAGLLPVAAGGVTALGAGLPARLAMVTQPSVTVVNDAALPVQPVVKLQDAGGNDVSQNGVVVTAGLVSGTPAVGSATAATVNGIATFAGLKLTGLVGSYTLRFSAPALSGVSASGATAITPAGASQLGLATEPAFSTVQGQQLPRQPVVQVRDLSGNAVAMAGVNVTATTVGSTATISGTAVIASDPNGVAAFPDLGVSAVTSSTIKHVFAFTAGGLSAATAAESTVVGAPLNNGVPVVQGGVVNSETPFAITVPAGFDSLVVTISDPTGFQTADLYLRFGLAPDPGNGLHDCFPNLSGANEQCTIPNPQAGTWYATVYGFPFSFSNVTLVARLYP